MDEELYGLTGANVTLRMLKTWANEMAMAFWGVNYTGTMELVSTRWKYRAAAYRYKTDGSYRAIRFSRYRNSRSDVDSIKDCLAHELVHWRLETTGRPHADTDNEFIAECLRIGAGLSSSKSARFAAYRYDTEQRLSHQI